MELSAVSSAMKSRLRFHLMMGRGPRGGKPADGPEVKRRLRLQLGKFTLAAMGELGARRGQPLDALVREAALHYLSNPDARGTWRYPHFVDRVPRKRSGITLELEADLIRTATAEADRQQVSLERLLEHAVLYYLAEQVAE